MLYLDNAATSWPKPQEVVKAMEKALTDYGASPGRGTHSSGSERKINRTRELLGELFGTRESNRIVFTLNATHAINTAIKGVVKPGDHVITTTMEHNAVTRPLKYLEKTGVRVTYVNNNQDGNLDLNLLEKAITKDTKLIITCHGSNVTGNIYPVAQIGKLAKQYGLIYLVDAAQTAGVIPIDVEQMGIDLLAFPGHKGLLGPPGTGGLYVGPDVDLEPLILGGTGRASELDSQPDIYPDKLESGTINFVGIAGLRAGVEYLLKNGLEKIRLHEQELCALLVKSIETIPGIKIYGPKNQMEKAPLVSINIADADSREVEFVLNRVYKVAVRAGLHCAPFAHRTIGTLSQGTIRISPSLFTSEKEIMAVGEALKEIARDKKK